jgi:4-amino-4-deoxy-L-arabinose transferase-like glycosyltransferase
LWLLSAILVALGILSWATLYIDHPFLIATNSRALYVDEGFYSDAAQNFAKFGRWGFPYDFPQWTGAPFLTFIQTLVFPVFGASLETARLLSTVLSLISGLAFYAIIRTSLKPAPAVLLTSAGLLTISYVTHGRSALVEPTAVCAALLALAVYVRVRDRRIAIPLSVILASAAFLSKMYFLFTLGAVTGLWILELFVAPVLARRPLEKGPVVILVASLAAVAAFYAGFLYVFGEYVADYYYINRHKTPALDFEFVINSLVGSLKLLPYNTKTHLYLIVLLLLPACMLILLLRRRTRALLATRLGDMGRAELAIGLWLVMGLFTIGVLNSPKPHYHFFAVLPLCFAGTIGLKLVFPYHLHTAVITGAAVLHLAFQLPFYYEWFQRQERTAIVDASREVVSIIERNTDEQMIPVNGEYSAQLGLFSDRIFSLDVKWSPAYPYCHRIEFWKPRYHINIVWPGSASRGEIDLVEDCEIVADTSEIERFSLFDPRGDVLVLSRIHYE